MVRIKDRAVEFSADASEGGVKRVGRVTTKESSTSGSRIAGWVADYAGQSRRPLASLAFVVPLLVLYEGGVLLLGQQAVRNGADVWLRQLLDFLGFGQYFLLPAMTVGLLLAWHHVTRERWQLSVGVLYVMFAECAVLGLLLVMLGRLGNVLSEGTLVGRRSEGGVALAIAWLVAGRGVFVGRMIGFVGAGVYEEMLFRLMLLPPAATAAKWLGANRGLCVAIAVVVTSVLFSAAHYVGPYGESFEAFSFWFRAAAGGLFGLLFVYRGFGIAAGAHAMYDIMVSVG